MRESERVLVCLRYGIGDVVMELPALRALRAACPAAEIWLLGARPALELFARDPDFPNLICVQDFGFAHWGDRGDGETRQAFRRWLAAARFDAVFDVAHTVVGIQDCITRLGWMWRHEPEHLSPRHDHAEGWGVAAVWRSAMEAWGLRERRDEPAPAPRLLVPLAAKIAARGRLRRWCSGQEQAPDIVGIAPTASSAVKCWPVARMLELIEWLTRTRGLRVLIFGIGANQPRLIKHLHSITAPASLHVVAPTHLQETAALLGYCRAFISNDTGLMHMAAAAGTPTLGLFGPTDAAIYLPPGARAVSGSRPCHYRLAQQFGPPQCVCSGRCLVAAESCMTTITTAQVITELNALLASTPAATTRSEPLRWR